VTKICVATPAYGEVVYVPCMQSLLRLQRALMRRGDQLLQIAVSYPEVSEARNFLLTYWFDKTDASHILFVDADMGFDPELVLEMLAFDKPVVGVIYPRRYVNLQRIVEAAAKGDAPPRAIARAHDFIVRPLKGKQAKPEKGFVEVEACGAGVLLVSRACIEEMLKKRPLISDRAAKKYSPLARELERLIRAFDPMTVDGVRLSDDFAFCHRWRAQCGGAVWARADRAVSHMGTHRYEARLVDAVGGPHAVASLTPPGGAKGDGGKPAVTLKAGTPQRVKEAAKPARLVKARLAPPKSLKPAEKGGGKK
jgi:hypothetical protein